MRLLPLSLAILGIATLTPLRAGEPAPATPEALGAALFFDPDLSANRSQSCATCHDPAHGFADPRPNATGGAVSLGDDGRSLGDRNAPTAAYAALTPPFGRAAKPNLYRGGLFHDGRAADLAAQAAGPPLNPIEMGLKDAAAVVARLKEKPATVGAFEALYGKGVLDDPKRGYRAFAEAIAAYERSEVFRPFDSRYDRALRGEIALSAEEELGRVLFFSNQFTNCSQCHRLHPQGGAAREPFTTYEFHNIGVPANAAARAANGSGPGRVDRGLVDNPAVRDRRQLGRFKVPTLRNVAVTGPYMHNGVFRDLRTVVLFYNRYNTTNPARQVNPETGRPFDPPEVPATLSLKELEHGPALDDRRVDALVAFLKALTDRRYEHLLDPPAKDAAAK